MADDLRNLPPAPAEHLEDREADLRHDRKVAAVMLAGVLGLAIFVAGVQVGIRHGKGLARATEAAAGEAPRPAVAASDPWQDPAWQQAAEAALLRGEMLRSCDPVLVAAEINRADAHRESAIGANAGGTVALRQLYALGAVASELWLQRCLRWFGAR